MTYSDGEFYELTPRPNVREVIIRCGKVVPDERPGRAQLLAQALSHRYAKGMGAYVLTPAKFEKWQALFEGGFSARWNGAKGAWVFVHGHRSMPLARAIRKARGPRVIALE